MSLIDVAMNRSRATLAALVLLMVAGLFAYLTIPREIRPQMTLPYIYTSLSLDGISPEDSERLLIGPVEKELRPVEGVNKMTATAYQGGGNVLLEFEAGFDIDVALDEVREAADKAANDLPEAAKAPTVSEVDVSEWPVLVVHFSSSGDELVLMNRVRDIADRLKSLPEVIDARMVGERDEVVMVEVLPTTMELYNIKPADMLAGVAATNVLVASGVLDTGGGRFAIQVPGRLETLTDILALPVATNGTAVVRLGELARIRYTLKDPRSFARLNGEKTISLEIVKRSGENIIDTVDRVREEVSTLSSDWPDGITISYTDDESNLIRGILGDLQNNILMAVVLVMIIVLGVLGVRTGIMVGLGIPTSLFAAVLLIMLSGGSLNIIVLFSLILAVGMLVDGAVVVTEYADKEMRNGINIREAYRNAAARMAWPVISSTATTLAAFGPLLFWPGIMGQFMMHLPLTLIFVLSAALLMALIFIPVLGANFAGVLGALCLPACIAAGAGLGMLPGILVDSLPALARTVMTVVGAVAGLVVGIVLARRLHRRLSDNPYGRRSVDAHALPDLSRLRGPARGYVALLRLALATPLRAVMVLLFVIGGTGSSLYAYATYGRGIEFFPDIEPERIRVQVYARGNLSVREQDLLVREVEAQALALARERGEFRSVYVSSGLRTGAGEQREDLVGTIAIEYVDWDLRRPSALIEADLRARIEPISGITTEIAAEEGGPPSGKPVDIRLSGDNLSDLSRAVGVVREHVETVEGIYGLEDTRPLPGIQWNLRIDRSEALRFGLDIGLVGRFVRMITEGLKLTDYRPENTNDEVDVLLRYPLRFRNTEQLDHFRLVGPTGGAIPLEYVFERRAAPRTGTITRTDGERTRSVRSEVEDGYNVNEIISGLRETLPTLELPAGVQYAFAGEADTQAESQEFLRKAFIVSLFMILIILLLQFNNFYYSFLILLAVVLSTAGVLLGLLITGQPFGVVMCGIGVISLAGIVVNNNIVLIDAFIHIRREVSDPLEAVLLTGAQRLRPVLLTAATTVLGLLPMVLKLNFIFADRTILFDAPASQWWVQLSTAIVSGMTFASLLTLLFTPTMLILREYVLRGRRPAVEVGRPAPVL